MKVKFTERGIERVDDALKVRFVPWTAGYEVPSWTNLTHIEDEPITFEDINIWNTVADVQTLFDASDYFRALRNLLNDINEGGALC